MEAQAQAQKLAAQHVAQATLRGLHPPPAPHAQQQPRQLTPTGQPESMEVKEELGGHDEPTDLTLDSEEKALRIQRERLEREHLRNNGQFVSTNHEEAREREQLEPRHLPPTPQFDFRHLLPQVSIKSEWK